MEKEICSDGSCPECGSLVISKWSGEKCSNEDCNYWYCY